MFSIFHGLFGLVAIISDNCSKNIQDSKSRKEAIKDGMLTYHKSRGNEYLVENNKWVSTKRNHDGEDVIADMHTGEIYYNLTEIKKENKSKECSKRGKTVRPCVDNEQRQTYYGKYKQPFSLIDISTNTPVNEVCINGVMYYIRLDNGRVLRPIDNYKINNKVGHWGTKEIVDIINDRQNKYITQIDTQDYDWIKNNFFFYLKYVYVDSSKEIHVFNSPPKSSQWEYIKVDGGYNKLGMDW